MVGRRPPHTDSQKQLRHPPPNGRPTKTRNSVTRRRVVKEPTETPKTSIAPLLNVRRGSAAIDFYKAAFGATELFRITSESGDVVARLSIEGAEFWLADESPSHDNFSPETLSGSTTRIILTVADPDTAFARAITAGAKEVWPVADQWGWRVGRVVDPFGHHWEIGKPLCQQM